MMPLAFVDTETTGLHQDKQLWEVAIIRRDHDVSIPLGFPEDGKTINRWTETRYEAFVPVDLSNADLFGLNVGRFYERHPYGRYLSGINVADDCPRWDEMTEPEYIAQQIARMTHGCRFIGGAPSFDAEVLGDFLREHGLLPTWHHRLVDTHDLLTGYLIGRQYEGAFDLPKDPYSLSKDEKVKLLGIEPHNDPKLVHTAMGDAQHEADIWDAVMG